MTKDKVSLETLFSLVLLIEFIFLNGSTALAGQSIPINLTSAQPSVTASDTIRIDNITVPGIGGTYWAKFRWNPNTYNFEIIDAGASSVQPQPSQNYTWHIDAQDLVGGSALVSFTVSGDKIEGTVTSTGPGTFPISPPAFTATQNSRQLTFTISPILLDSNSALMTSPEEGDLWSNMNLNSGVTIHFTMSSFPSWFNLNQPFKLCCYNSCFNVSP